MSEIVSCFYHRWSSNHRGTLPVTGMAKKPAPPPLHVVVFPWLAFGHIVPFLDLAQQLARRGHFVTFLSTPRNVARIRPVPPELSPYIRFVSLPLPAVDGLRDGAEATSDHRVPCALFFIFPAAFVAFVGPKELNDAHPRTAAEHFMVPPPWIPPPSPIAYRRQEAEWIAGAFQPNASGVADSVRMLETVRRCALLVCRCSREVDGALCTLLDGIYGKPVVPSGLLAPYDAAAAASSSDAAGGGDDEETASLVRWLDAQPERSVIYVAFGSEAPLTPALVREIAQGLELAGVRFLWALRETSGGMLPDRFEARARAGGRGLVRVGWVPQVRVLAHAAVGGFFTHAGLSSLVDSFLFGHPLVMLPLFGDQGLTARLMAERRVGLEVPRDDRDGSVRREDVAAAVRRVMVEDEGEVFAGNARELREILWDTARQEEYIDELVEHLRRRQED
nr:putative UDP-rhamnose:rhamnosyltransferase 1 [Setaria viridis]